MLRNNADARRRSNIELGLPVVIWTRFQGFPYIELTSWSRYCFSSQMVLVSLYIKRRKEGKALIRKYPN